MKKISDIRRQMSDKFFLMSVICSLISLSACALPADVPLTGSGSLRDVIHTATGVVQQIRAHTQAAIELGSQTAEKAKDTAAELQRRAEEIKQGIDKMQDGKEQVQKALAR